MLESQMMGPVTHCTVNCAVITRMWTEWVRHWAGTELMCDSVWGSELQNDTLWSYAHTCAERRRADFDIPAPLPRVCSHIRGADAGGSAISQGQWWFGARGFEAGAVNWVLDPFLAEQFLLPLRLRSATTHVWTHVLICVEANFPPAPARARPRMCERTFSKMTWWNYEHHQPWNWPSLTKILQVQHQNG